MTSAGGSVRLYLGAAGESAIKVAGGRKIGHRCLFALSLCASPRMSVPPQRPHGTHLELSRAISFEASPARVRGH